MTPFHSVDVTGAWTTACGPAEKGGSSCGTETGSGSSENSGLSNIWVTQWSVHTLLNRFFFSGENMREREDSLELRKVRIDVLNPKISQWFSKNISYLTCAQWKFSFALTQVFAKNKENVANTLPQEMLFLPPSWTRSSHGAAGDMDWQTQNPANPPSLVRANACESRLNWCQRNTCLLICLEARALSAANETGLVKFLTMP